jgi:NAD(P)-dependent dehydrogenase (short-subunit alcohol dehydrogenase family)
MSQRKVAFVTGASSGIGLATAEAFLRKGYATVLADRDTAGGEAALARLEAIGPCRFVPCDVADPASVNAAVAGAVASFGRIDAAFNAAGIDGTRAPLLEATQENWDRIIAVNLTGIWHSMRAQVAQMVRQGGGAIVNCASSAGLVGTVMLPAYVASKHGVVGITKATALDYVRQNIRVNAVCPGMIDTPMWQRAISPELTEELLKTDAIGRLGKPGEIAAAVVWLCDDSASFVTGQALAVDGGFTAH